MTRSASIIAIVLLLLVSCSGNADVVDGPANAESNNEAPYGPGAQVGETYDYVLYVHCGVEWARIDGVWWESELRDDRDRNPPDGWGNPHDAGKLTIIDEHTADYVGGPGTTVRFTRTDRVESPLACD